MNMQFIKVNDMEFFDRWFLKFSQGLDNMSEEECGRLFKPCAAACAKDALKYLYQDLFHECKGDLDSFFTRLHEVNGVDGRVIKSGSEYEIMFLNCNCDLRVRGHVESPKLCECSRQSIICELKALLPEEHFMVNKVSTILSSDPYCCFRIIRA